MKHYQKYLFGQLDGQDVEAYRLENNLGYQIVCHDLWCDDLRVCDTRQA